MIYVITLCFIILALHCLIGFLLPVLLCVSFLLHICVCKALWDATFKGAI